MNEKLSWKDELIVKANLMINKKNVVFFFGGEGWWLTESWSDFSKSLQFSKRHQENVMCLCLSSFMLISFVIKLIHKNLLTFERELHRERLWKMFFQEQTRIGGLSFNIPKKEKIRDSDKGHAAAPKPLVVNNWDPYGFVLMFLKSKLGSYIKRLTLGLSVQIIISALKSVGEGNLKWKWADFDAYIFSLYTHVWAFVNVCTGKWI